MATREYPIISALEIAEYFLFLADEDFTAIEPITPMKLQKLVYYAQGYSLALHHQPLFRESIAAWKHGPVIQPLYYAYKRYGGGPVPAPQNYDPSQLSPRVTLLLGQVYGTYGRHGAWELSAMTHEEMPYRKTSSGAEISHELMHEFFGQQLRSAAALRREASEDLAMSEPEEFTSAERERLIAAAIATQALEGYTLPREVAVDALDAALRKPLLDLR